jgi:hypothetical protein
LRLEPTRGRDERCRTHFENVVRSGGKLKKQTEMARPSDAEFGTDKTEP